MLHYNSKTPGSVPQAFARQAARRWLGMRGAERLRFWSRLPTVALLAALLGLVFVVGRRFLGETAACLATTTCALDPNLIANGAVATVDTAFALATLSTLASVLWLLERPSLLRAATVGVCLGLAFAAKFTAFLLVPAVAVVPVLVPALRARLRTATVIRSALVATAASLFTISAAYGFRDVGVELNDVGWRSPQMLRLHSLVPHLRIPVPPDFLTGFDVLAVAVDKDYPVVVLDRHFPRGVWYYFLVLWVLKTPVLLLAAQVHGLARTVATRTLWRDPSVCYLAASLGLFLVYFSFFFTTQVGFRFVLMCLPLVALVAAAGLAPALATHTGRRAFLAVAVLAAAENVPYLGNHLAFTSALVWPKKDAFRLVNNANLDWGQNDGRIRGWLAEAGLAAAPFNPPHALPGDNVLSANALAGVGKFGQHRWLRDNVPPRAHFGHTYLWVRLDPATFERMMDEDRRLTPLAEDARRCEQASPGGTLRDGAPAELPSLGRTEALLLCVTTPGPLDLGLLGDQGTVVIGPARERLRDQPLLRPGQQSWYRLGPGTSALSVFASNGFEGRWSLRGGEASLATRRVPALRGTIVEEEGDVPLLLSPP